MFDLAQLHLHGPVQSLRIERAEWDLAAEDWKSPRTFEIFVFRRDGKISSSEHRNPNGSVSRSNYDYDKAGRLTERQFQVDDGEVHRNICRYDDVERLLQTVSVDGNGVQTVTETFNYDTTGRKTKVQVVPSSANVPIFFAIEGSDLNYGAEGAATMTTFYDDSELPVEALISDANRVLLRRVIFTRDRNGRLEKAEMQLGNDQAPFPEMMKKFENATAEERAHLAALLVQLYGPRSIMSSVTYAYDEKGRRVERHERMGEMSEERWTYRFDEHGNPTEEIREHTHRDMNLNDAGNLQSANEVSTYEQRRTAYKYDNHGNWTERVVSLRLEQNPEFQRTNIERRTIRYYEA